MMPTRSEPLKAHPACHLTSASHVGIDCKTDSFCESSLCFKHARPCVEGIVDEVDSNHLMLQASSIPHAARAAHSCCACADA